MSEICRLPSAPGAEPADYGTQLPNLGRVTSPALEQPQGYLTLPRTKPENA